MKHYKVHLLATAAVTVKDIKAESREAAIATALAAVGDNQLEALLHRRVSDSIEINWNDEITEAMVDEFDKAPENADAECDDSGWWLLDAPSYLTALVEAARGVEAGEDVGGISAYEALAKAVDEVPPQYHQPAAEGGDDAGV